MLYLSGETKVRMESYKPPSTIRRRVIYDIMALERTKIKKICITLLFFFIAGLCEIGGGYLVWLWLRDGMSWVLGAAGGFILFVYGVVPTFQPSYFHRIYAAYGGIFIAMAVLWGWTFEGIAPDRFDVIGTAIALAGVAIIFYMPRKGKKGEEKAAWS